MDEPEVYVGKLISGEFVIGRLLNNIILANVFKINIQFDTSCGSPNINLIPLMYPILEDLSIISLNQLLVYHPAPAKFIEIYAMSLKKILDSATPQSEEVESKENNDQNGE